MRRAQPDSEPSDETQEGRDDGGDPGLLLPEDGEGSREDTWARQHAKHVQRPAEVDAAVVERGGESGGEDTKDDDADMAPADDVAVRRAAVEVLPVDVECDDARDGDDLGRYGRGNGHEGDEQHRRGATFARDGYGRVREDEAVGDFHCGHAVWICWEPRRLDCFEAKRGQRHEGAETPGDGEVCDAADDVSRDYGLWRGREGFREKACVHDDQAKVGEDVDNTEKDGLWTVHVS